jgi:hypothetical protein
MRVKLIDDFNVNLRIDLFELAVREVSVDQELTYREALQSYEEN